MAPHCQKFSIGMSNIQHLILYNLEAKILAQVEEGFPVKVMDLPP